MKLYRRIIEAQCPANEKENDLIIIHGLFGMSDNWLSIGKALSSKRRVIIPDLRNHGQSPHSDNFSTELMVEDIAEMLLDLNSNNPILLGHSMGGRVAMKYALSIPDGVSKLIVADMSLRPPKLREEHWAIFQSMKLAPIEQMHNFKEIELFLSQHIQSKRLTQFILKNIHRTKEGFRWKLNFMALMNSFEKSIPPLASEEIFDAPSLFVRGGNSDYILAEDYEAIYAHFPLAIIETIEGASHWLHADKPKEFIHIINSFL